MYGEEFASNGPEGFIEAAEKLFLESSLRENSREINIIIKEALCHLLLLD